MEQNGEFKTVDVPVQAGRIGLNYICNTGKAMPLISDEQANYLGVELDWRIKFLDGDLYGEGRLREKATGTTPYMVTFSKNGHQIQSEIWAASGQVCPPCATNQDGNQAAISPLGPTTATEHSMEHLLSQGSVGHPLTCASACKYHGKLRGCKEGAACSRCHLCKWTNSPAVRKRHSR
jgi:hypothetical protein